MMRGWCEDCQTTQPITPTGRQIRKGTPGSASYKQLDLHKVPGEEKLCEGSGKLL